MMFKPILTLLACTFMLGACASVPVQQETLNGQWKLTEIGGETISLPQAFIRFDTEKLGVAASVGCNRIFGRYHLHESRLTFSPPASTRMACANPEQSRLETALGRALAGAAGGSYSINGNSLDIRNRDGYTVLKAERE